MYFFLKQRRGFFTNKNLLPEFFCGTEAFTSGAITSGAVSTETHVGRSITGPGQRALERAAQVVKRPRYNDVIV